MPKSPKGGRIVYDTFKRPENLPAGIDKSAFMEATIAGLARWGDRPQREIAHEQDLVTASHS